MTNDPDVTIVVVPMEQFSKSETSLESIYAATPRPFRLVYVAATPRVRLVATSSSRRRRWDLSLYELRIICPQTRRVTSAHQSGLLRSKLESPAGCRKNLQSYHDSNSLPKLSSRSFDIDP